MTFGGHVENGVVVLDEDIQLPNGTPVTVEILDDISRHPIHPKVREMTGLLPTEIDVEASFANQIMLEHQYLSTRAAKGNRKEFEQALQAIPDVEPEAFDKL